DGRATNLYISVQPSGAIFDPPLEVSFPNLDREPANAKVLLMSFDHDAGRYVQAGTGHVSADGKTVISDPDNGIRVGAWHGFPPVAPSPETNGTGGDGDSPSNCDAWFCSSPAIPLGGGIYRASVPSRLSVCGFEAKCSCPTCDDCPAQKKFVPKQATTDTCQVEIHWFRSGDQATTIGCSENKSPVTFEVLLGQQVKLKGVSKPGSPRQSNWSIGGGEIIKDFSSSESKSEITRLPVSEIQSDQVIFCFVEPKIYTIQYTALVNNKAYTAIAKFEVIVPGIDIDKDVSTRFGNFFVYSDSTGVLRGGLGKSGGTPQESGIQFKLNSPSNYEIQWVQLVLTGDRDFCLNDEPYFLFAEGLDCNQISCYPYSGNKETNDSPNMALPAGAIKARASDSFKMYLMYKPDKNSTWVTLAVIEWNWACNFQFVSNHWVPVISSQKKMVTSKTSSHEFPKWNKNVRGMSTFTKQPKFSCPW
ncbi:MAG: hypothetical protein HY774_28935, partial [Acidobacteria bacterium]|nr:hypothetical protein [Acidobacteriota bacterium]